ncbi:N-acetylglucosamine-6-phosphate deacetylase [Treponema primitia ZAS-2]|uniref:N-acetylglucosamine-6-phosphate deacetylase n=2 Tax=Treponema primitia TaxID=88058 RepID=F5YK58_TREPZ|nr:N-acetylglucosamine-6-phosphate deacetylase [Treponema primitia ZAS-2]
MTGFAAMEHCAVLIEDGLVADVFSARRFEQKHFAPSIKTIDVQGAYIAPGFIDTHIHGFGGYGTEDGSTDSVIEMSRLLGGCGVSAFNPTLYPSEPEEMLQAVANITAAMGKEKGARIMGIHLEGPFLSPDRLGVQRPETVKTVDIPFMEKLWEAAGGHIVNMTVAPELKGMRELALFCIKKGIVLQAGHTDAKYENMVEGMQVGILHSTHLFNAMSKLDHRNPNAVGTILTHPEISCEIIADGFHVHPDLFKLLLRDKPIDKIILVTDGLKPTGQTEGPFFANGEEVVFQDGFFRRKSDGVIAGSGLTMIRGVKNLVSFGFSLEDAVKAASTNPAQVMRYKGKGTIIPGNDADLVVFDHNFTVLASLVGGDIKYNSL